MENNSYLIIRDGSKWADVVRLVPGESVTLGRAPTNTIVIKDERCSRNHAEVFQAQGEWKLRDLESRNGTIVSGDPVTTDRPLSPGDIIQIGNSHLAFVHDLSQAFPDSGALLKGSKDVAVGDAKEDALTEEAGSIFESFEPTTITHRKGQSRFLDVPTIEESDEDSLPKVGRAAAMLCRLAFDLARSNG